MTQMSQREGVSALQASTRTKGSFHEEQGRPKPHAGATTPAPKQEADPGRFKVRRMAIRCVLGSPVLGMEASHSEGLSWGAVSLLLPFSVLDFFTWEFSHP